MYLAHYLIPLLLFFIFKDKIMLYGLLLANLIDLDHIFLRIFGSVPLFGSICGFKEFWKCNGFFGYPFHSPYVWIFFIITSFFLAILREKNKDSKEIKLLFFISLGIVLHLFLDFIQLSTGVAFVINSIN